jgi:RNA:NAD 2'-phosphotransferase (TPT1/KptA family)
VKQEEDEEEDVPSSGEEALDYIDDVAEGDDGMHMASEAPENDVEHGDADRLWDEANLHDPHVDTAFEGVAPSPADMVHESMHHADDRRIRRIRDTIRNMVRHGHYHCVPDDDGWVAVRWLTSQACLRKLGCSQEDTIAAVAISEGRMEMNGDCAYLRCLRGHSLAHVTVPVIHADWHELPDTLFHCTKPHFARLIEEEGLKKPEGNVPAKSCIFLSTTPRQANGRRPVIFEVSTRCLRKAGITLSWCGEGGRATGVLECRHDIIPARFLKRAN